MPESTGAAVARTEAPQTGQNAPKRAKAKRRARPPKKAPRAKQGATGAQPTKQAKAGHTTAAKPKKATKPGTEARDGSKKAIVLDLLRRPKGATLDEIMKATKWQAHSVRGFIAGPVKHAGYAIESSKSETGERTYRIAK